MSGRLWLQLSRGWGPSSRCYRPLPQAWLWSLSTTFLLSKEARALTLFFFFQNTLALLGLLNFHLNLRSGLVSPSAEWQCSHTWLYVPLAVLFVFQLFRRAGRRSPGGCGRWTAGHVWRLRRSRVHLRILGTCYVMALQGGAPHVTLTKGRHPCLVLATGRLCPQLSLQDQKSCPPGGRTCLTLILIVRANGSGSLWRDVSCLWVPRKHESTTV